MFPAFFTNQEPRKTIVLSAWNSLTLELSFPEESHIPTSDSSVYLYVEVKQQKYPGVHLSVSTKKIIPADPANELYGPVTVLYKNNSSQDVSIDLVTESDAQTTYSIKIELEEDYIPPTPLNTGLTKAHKKIEFGKFGEQFEVQRDNHLSVLELHHLPDYFTALVRLEFYHSDDQMELPVSKDKNWLDLASVVGNYQDIHLLTIESTSDQTHENGTEIGLTFAYANATVRHH